MSTVKEHFGWKAEWTIHKYRNELDAELKRAYEISRFGPNLGLNAGITVLLNLLCGTGTPTAYDNADAYLGVGDSTTAAAATQTGLQASTNKTYIGMQTGYPSVSAQTASWQSQFASGDANYAWNEFCLFNASAGGGTALNRLVSAQGTKASGQVWTLTLAITQS